MSSNKNRPRPVSYSVSIRVKLARSALRRILPGLSPQEPRRGVLAAGSPRGWGQRLGRLPGSPLKPRSGARGRGSIDLWTRKKKMARGPGAWAWRARRLCAEPATPSLLACPRKGKVRPANPVRGATRSPKIGGRQGVDNPKP